MAVSVGPISVVSVGSNSDSLLVAAASGGTGPYTYEYHRSTVSGFTPGGGNLIQSGPSLSLLDSGLTPGTQYYYVVKAIDSLAASGLSAQLAVMTTAASPNPNQFALAPYLGMLDLRFNGDTISVAFDPAGSGSLVGGAAVKFSVNSSGEPLVVPSLASSDDVAGFVNYDIKSAFFGPGSRMEISMAGNVMYLYATAALNRGQFVYSLPAAAVGGTNGGVAPVTGSSGFPIIGYSLDSVASGSLCRIFLQTPAAPYAID